MVSIKNQLIRAAAVGAVGVAALAGFVAPASAAPRAGLHAAVGGAAVAVTKPNTNIQGSPAKWVPNKLTAPPTKGTCSATNYSFSMTNKTAKSQAISVNTGTGKKPFATIPAHKAIAVCGTGPKGAKAKFYIKGSTSVLTATLS